MDGSIFTPLVQLSYYFIFFYFFLFNLFYFEIFQSGSKGFCDLKKTLEPSKQQQKYFVFSNLLPINYLYFIGLKTDLYVISGYIFEPCRNEFYHSWFLVFDLINQTSLLFASNRNRRIEKIKNKNKGPTWVMLTFGSLSVQSKYSKHKYIEPFHSFIFFLWKNLEFLILQSAKILIVYRIRCL